LYIKLLNSEERGKGSSSKILALNLASILGSGFFLVLYNHAGWRATMLTMGAMVLSALCSLWFLEEKEQKERPAPSNTNWSSLLAFFRGKGMVKWTVLILIHSISTSAVFFMIKPFLVDRGVDPDLIAFVVGFYGMTLAAVVAMATGSRFFQKYLLQRRKAYIASAVINAVAVILFIPIALRHDLFIMLYIAVALLNASITISSVVSTTLVMDFSRKGFESIDYSMQMTGLHVGALAMASASGFIVAQTGYPIFFLMQGLIGIALIFLTVSLFKGKWIPHPRAKEGLDSDTLAVGH
jgi:predicted MFS family arabinose efflux permease